jgi:hypothetical protein
MRVLTYILILVSATYCFGQSGEQTKKRSKLTISEIKKLFPYNKTKSIRLVSFKYDYPKPDPDTVDGEVPMYLPEIPKTNGTIDLTKMFEVKTLDQKAEEKLLGILVNSDTKDIAEVAFCYAPRNGIVFFDELDNIVGYIEICFECLRYQAEPTTITVTTLYPKEYDALRDFFKEVGITYGTAQSDE